MDDILKLKFSELNKVFFTISDIMAEEQSCIGKKKFVMENPRPTDALILFTRANSICYQENFMPFYIPQGSLVYIPRFSKYIWEDLPVGEDDRIEKLLFEFTLNQVDTISGKDGEIILSSFTKKHISFGEKIFIVSTKDSLLYEKCFAKLIKAFEKRENSILSPVAEAYGLFDILSQKSKINEKLNIDFKIIEKGIEYIEENLCPEKKVFEIAEMCGVSVGHFERLFKSFSGVSPTEYINSNRILYIKKLLQNNSLKLTEIAKETGFCESGYLCRFFKRKTGMTPKEYRVLYNSSLNTL